MSEQTIRISTPEGKIELPLAQAYTLARLSEEHPASTWHINDCGCCVCLHPGGDSSKGWVVGPDGGAEYLEHRK